MADASECTEHFRKMARDDPDNELGHFSLGRAYLEAGDHDAAIASLKRVIQLNPQMSRAYQLAALAMLRKGMRQDAIDWLNRGIQVAHARGDLIPKGEMATMLQDLGAPLPGLGRAQPQRPLAQGEVHCARCGQIATKLADPPFRNATGKEIQQKVCELCWREWVAMGTKVINELRLAMNEPEAQRIFDQHMFEFLNLR